MVFLCITSIVLSSIALHGIALHRIAWHCIAFDYLLWYCMVLHGIVLHLIICYGIAWYCIDYTVVQLIWRAGELPRSASSHFNTIQIHRETHKDIVNLEIGNKERLSDISSLKYLKYSLKLYILRKL